MRVATLRDAVYGLAVGDALGVPYEFHYRGDFECRDMVGGGSHGKPAGTWSDDTSMTLATCDSIRETGRVDAEDMRRRFEEWLFSGRYTVDGVFDVGNATSSALRSGHGMTGERDNGNGSLMRIAPLAFMDATDDEVRAVSSITHAHAVSCEACVEYVGIARRLLAGTPVAEVCREQLGLSEDEVESTGYVVHTFNAALWCLGTTQSYAECVLKAVNLGDDTDTTAAVAGALAGIVYGMDAIPAGWLETLRGKEVIEACLF